MRKKIMKWLLGNDWEEYWDLHKEYCEQLSMNLELMDSPPSTTMLCPVQNVFSTVRKYAQEAISCGVAHLLRGV